MGENEKTTYLNSLVHKQQLNYFADVDLESCECLKINIIVLNAAAKPCKVFPTAVCIAVQICPKSNTWRSRKKCAAVRQNG